MKLKTLFIRQDTLLKRIDVSEVIVLKAEGNFVKLIGPGHHYLLRMTPDKAILIMGKDTFCKTSRSYAVSVPHTEEIGKDVVTLAGVDVPLSENFHKKVVARVHVADTM
jgi:two-component system, LytTR family, response regulator LytT